MAEAKIVVSATDNASRVLDQVKGGLADMQGVAARVGSALGMVGVAGIAGITAWITTTAHGVDVLNDLSDATGSSIENISAIEDVAARTGTSMETVSTAMIKFNAALKNATPDSPAAAALKALNLNIEDLKALDPAEALLQTATALSHFADDGNKARLTQELFGKSLKDVAPLLKDLADKGKLVATVTSEQAREAEKFNQELFKLKKNSEDNARSMVGPLVEAINKTIEAFRTGAIAGKSFYTVMREEQLRAIGLNDGPAEYAAQLDKVNAALAKGEPRALVRNALLREQASLQAKLKSGPDFSADNQSSAENARLNRRKSLPSTLGGKADKPEAEKISDAQTALASYVKAQQGQLDTAQKLTDEQKALNFLQSLGTTGEIAQVRELVLGQANQIDAIKAQEEATKALATARKSSDEYLAGIAKELDAQEKSNQKLREQVEEIGLSVEALDTLRLKRLDATIATEQQARAQLNLQNSSEAEIADMERKIELLQQQRNLTSTGQIATAAADSKTKADASSKEFADTLHNDLKGAFSTAFRDTSGSPLKAFGDALANVIYSRSATAMAEALIGSAGGTASGSLLGKLFSFDGGGYTGSGMRAGGVDGKGGFMAVMHPNETVLDHTKGQNGGSQQSVTVVQNFTVGDVASVAMVRQAVAGSERRIAGAMGRSMNYGGALA